MNNEQKIIDAIMADTRKEEERILSLAREEAELTVNEAKAQAEKENAPLIEKAKQSAKEIISKEISSAEMEAKKIILSERQSLLSETIAAAKNKLNTLSLEKYKEVISQMLNSVGDAGNSSVILSEKDKAGISDIFTAKGFVISDETRNINGGFIVKKGNIEYNYTFDSIFSASKEQLEETAAKILFN